MTARDLDGAGGERIGESDTEIDADVALSMIDRPGGLFVRHRRSSPMTDVFESAGFHNGAECLGSDLCVDAGGGDVGVAEEGLDLGQGGSVCEPTIGGGVAECVGGRTGACCDACSAQPVLGPTVEDARRDRVAVDGGDHGVLGSGREQPVGVGAGLLMIEADGVRGARTEWYNSLPATFADNTDRRLVAVEFVVGEMRRQSTRL